MTEFWTLLGVGALLISTTFVLAVYWLELWWHKIYGDQDD